MLRNDDGNSLFWAKFHGKRMVVIFHKILNVYKILKFP